MTSANCSMEKMIALCVEGARRFGDDPSAIANFIEVRISKLPDEEQRLLKEELALLTDYSQSHSSLD